MTTLTLNVGQGKAGFLRLFDAITGDILTAIFSNPQIVSNSNPAAAEFVINPSNQNNINAGGHAIGSGQVVISADVEYTDPGDGNVKNESVSVTKDFEVVGGAHGATFDVVFN